MDKFYFAKFTLWRRDDAFVMNEYVGYFTRDGARRWEAEDD